MYKIRLPLLLLYNIVLHWSSFSQSNNLIIDPSFTSIYPGGVAEFVVKDSTIGNCLQFTGNENIDIPYLSTYNRGNNETTKKLTVDFWIKPEKGTSTIWTFFNSNSPSSTSWELVLNDNSNFLFMEKRADGAVRNRVWTVESALDREQLLFDNKWHLLTIIFGRLQGETSAGAYIYIDGELKTVLPAVSGGRSPTHLWSLMAATNKMLIGSDRNNSRKFKGAIDDFGYYSRALTAQEIKERYAEGRGGFPSSLNSAVLFRYKLDESNGINIKDESTNNNTAMVLGAAAPMWSESSVFPIRPTISVSPATNTQVVEGYKIKASPIVTTTYTITGSYIGGVSKIGTVVINVVEGTNDFVTKSSGDWNDYHIWKKRTASGFVDAAEGEIPSQENAVFIQPTHTVTLTGNGQCKDLNLSGASDLTRLNTNENTLDVYGKMRLYGENAPGSSASAFQGVSGFIATGTNGRIRLKGTSSRVITEKDEFSDHENLKGWTLECDLAEGTIGIINSNFRAGNVIITSGSLEVKSKNFKVSK